MAHSAPSPGSPAPAGGPGFSLPDALENHEIACYLTCPFAIAPEDELAILRSQPLGWADKDIGYDPHTDRVTGYHRESNAQAARQRALFGDFSRAATDGVARTAPRPGSSIGPASGRGRSIP